MPGHFFAGAGGPEHISAENEYIDPSGPGMQEPIRVEKASGRNDTGQKYKHCHGKEI